jgi:hypothetical protein
VRALLAPMESGQEKTKLSAIFALLAIILPVGRVWSVAPVCILFQDRSIRVMCAPQESIPRMGRPTAQAVSPVDSLHQVIKHLANLVEMEDTLIRDQLDHRMIVVLAQQVFIRHPTQVLNAPCVLLASGVMRLLLIRVYLVLCLMG